LQPSNPPKKTEGSGFQRKQCVAGDSGNVNSDSGNVNTDSGKSAKVFTFNQKMCSRCIRTGVHVRPEWVFTMGRNMQLGLDNMKSLFSAILELWSAR